jgi:hypothetical protein
MGNLYHTRRGEGWAKKTTQCKIKEANTASLCRGMGRGEGKNHLAKE